MTTVPRGCHRARSLIDGVARRTRSYGQEALIAAPDYVLISTWNEWHEGSEIEPSAKIGSRFIQDTTAFSKEFLAQRR
jgi:hypothetical protein